MDIVSYNKDTFILSVTIVSKEKKSENISVCLRKTFTESYWQMMKCLCQCCDIGTCQNHDHIRTVNSKTKRLQHWYYLVRKQLEDFLWMNLWSLILCYLSRGFVLVGWFFFFFFNYTCSSFSFYNTVLLLNRNIQSFCRRKV